MIHIDGWCVNPCEVCVGEIHAHETEAFLDVFANVNGEVQNVLGGIWCDVVVHSMVANVVECLVIGD